MQKVLLFVNPFLEQRRNQRATIERIVALLRSKDLEVELQETHSPRSAGDQAREGIAAGFDTIVACGGDGTIFDVVQGVAGSEIPLGIIPMGTGNVLAQNLGLPRSPLAAAEALFRSRPKRVPLGKLTSHRPGHRRPGTWYFACVAGLGTHAYLMSAAERWGKRFSGRASYYFAGIELLARQRIEPFEVEFTTTDGRVIQRQVGEAIATRVAALNRWRPGGSLEQPTLRLAICDATTRFGLARASFEAIARLASSNGRASVQYFDVVRIVCRPVPDYDYQNPVLVEADGEVLGAREAVITIAGEGIHLLWPD